ncbi:MAG: hypothetical protein WA213_18865 [Terriglobales bacterium]
MMTAVFGYPEKLWLRPIDNARGIPPWEGIDAKSGVTLNCFHVCTFSASEGKDKIRANVNHLLALCRRTVNNIGTRRVEEHIYQLDDAAWEMNGARARSEWGYDIATIRSISGIISLHVDHEGLNGGVDLVRPDYLAGL